MRHINLLLAFVIAMPAMAQKKTEEIFSAKLNAKREITVTLPQYYKQDKNKKYPLLVLLDGDYLVDPFTGVLSYTSYWDELPETIVVGINQNYGKQREEDVRFNDATGLPEGSGDNFFQFISDELLPYLEKNYRISPYRIIAGHDMTATFSNLFLYKETSPFNGYISFSPDLATEMETRIPEMLEASKKPVFFYLATSEGDVDKLKKKIKILDTNIKAVKNPNLKYVYEEFGAGSHYSLVPYGIPGALYSVFSGYRPISSIEYKEKIVTLPSGYVDYLKNKYANIEKDLGVDMKIRIIDIKAIEAAIMKNTMYEELKDLADLAKKNYPKKIIGEYYEALYYEMTGNLKKAKKIYMGSFSLEPIGDYDKDFMIAKAEKLNVQ